MSSTQDLEMHAIQQRQPQQGYRDEPTEGVLNDEDDMSVSNITSNDSNGSIPPKVRVAVLGSIALILLITGIIYGKNELASKPISTLYDDISANSNNSTTLDGSIIEFTVANLNTNIDKCYVSSKRLECVPNHDNSTNRFRIQLNPTWSPRGVERFEELTRVQFWNEARIFRVIPSFVSQFGLSSYPSTTEEEWMEEMEDDPVVGSNVRGTVTFATAGANTRTTQIFINTGDNEFLDQQGFSPIGVVLDAGDEYGGMEVVDEFYAGYGEKPDQGLIRTDGIEYLDDKFPNLSFFVSAEFVEE